MAHFIALDLPMHLLEVQAAFDALDGPTQPTPLWAATTARMPPAALWKYGQLWNLTVSRIAVSNGVNWLRTDTGAILA